MTVSHWRWHADNLDSGAGIQLGQCLPIIIMHYTYVLMCHHNCSNEYIICIIM